MFCVKCGNKMNGTDAFCSKCGEQCKDNSILENKDNHSIKVKVNCKECNDVLVDIILGESVKDNYKGADSMCLNCKIMDSKCPVCSLELRTKKSSQCRHCLSSWFPVVSSSELEKRKQILTSGVIRKKKTKKISCPECKSTDFTTNKKGFGLGKAVGGLILTGGVGLLGGFIGSQKINITCLSCGNRWTPKKVCSKTTI